MSAPALVISAAGASLRLGCDKALVELGGRAAVLRLLDTAAAVGLANPGNPALVITGANHERVAAALRAAGCEAEVHHNPDWSAGRSGGLALALPLRPARDLLLAPVDCPLVGRQVFLALCCAWERAGEPPRGWLGPRLEPRPRSGSGYGHPVLAGRELAAGLASLSPGAPLHDLRARAQPLLSVAVQDGAILDHLDEPHDLQQLRARWASAPEPSQSTGERNPPTDGH